MSGETTKVKQTQVTLLLCSIKINPWPLSGGRHNMLIRSAALCTPRLVPVQVQNPELDFGKLCMVGGCTSL